MSPNSILSTVLLPLQLCLGFWQIVKLTPVGAIIQCGIGWLLYQCCLPLGLSADYGRLRRFQGHIYKTVRCHVTTDLPTTVSRKNGLLNLTQKSSSYLGEPFHLEKRGEANVLYVNGTPCYYITNDIWNALMDFAEAAPDTVFLKGYKEFWQQVATGGVMGVSDVLDSLILENHTVRFLDNDLLLPVNLCVSEEKLLKVLNLAGLFLQTRKVYRLIPILLSLTSALLEFSTTVRARVYHAINLLFCWGMHKICDRLRRSLRRQVYSLGNWVENLKPSNDLKLRVVRGQMGAVIGGGAKVNREGAVLFESEEVLEWSDQEEDRKAKTINCGTIDADYQPIDILCWFNATKRKCRICATTVALADVDCDMCEFAKLYKFLTCVAKNGSGSLKSCDSNNKVRVRGFREAVACYSKSGFPPVYELKLDGVVVE